MTGTSAGRDGRGRDRTRRQVLASSLGAAGLVGLAGCTGDGDDGSDGGTPTPTSGHTNLPVGETVTIGLAIPETGVYSSEGEQLRQGYEAAQFNLNDGRGWADTDQFEDLGGDGILGAEVELAVRNTDSGREGARDAADSLIEDDGAVMVSGGASTGEALALQEAATEHGVVHMIGFAPGNSISGVNCSQYGFQEMYPPKLAAQALAPYLAEELGGDTTFGQVYPRSDVGEDFQLTLQQELSNTAGWVRNHEESTRVGTQNFEDPIGAVLDTDPDVIILNYYGNDGARALRQADEVIDEEDDVDVVVPLYNRPMAESAGGAIEDVIGTVTWDPGVDSRLSSQFDSWWIGEFGQRSDVSDSPSDLSHLAYSQLFQYAAAVNRAGSFEPPAVIDALEGHTYDHGMGEQEMRGCDHLAQRPVPIVRGLPASEQFEGVYYEVESVVEDVGFPCDEPPALDCDI